MNKYSGAFRSAVSVLFSAVALATSAQAESRGELLYSTHCIACHTSQMHWRDQKAATNWSRLKAEVRRWQGTVALNWSEADIVEVARYLNETIYRFPQTSDPLASQSPPTADFLAGSMCRGLVAFGGGMRPVAGAPMNVPF